MLILAFDTWYIWIRIRWSNVIFEEIGENAALVFHGVGFSTNAIVLKRVKYY